MPARYGDGANGIFDVRHHAQAGRRAPDRRPVSRLPARDSAEGRHRGSTRPTTTSPRSWCATGLADHGRPGTSSRCFDVVTGLKLKASSDAVADIRGRPGPAREPSGPPRSRRSLALDPDRAVPGSAGCWPTADEPVAVRERAAQALGGSRTPAAYAELLSALEKAPARLQTVVAAALASQAGGGRTAARRRSPPARRRPGCSRTGRFRQRLNESRLPKVARAGRRADEGAADGRPADAELMGQRRDGFAKAKPDAEARGGGVQDRIAPTATSSAARGRRSARSSTASASAGWTGCSKTSSIRPGTSTRRCGPRRLNLKDGKARDRAGAARGGGG